MPKKYRGPQIGGRHAEMRRHPWCRKALDRLVAWLNAKGWTVKKIVFAGKPKPRSSTADFPPEIVSEKGSLITLNIFGPNVTLPITINREI